MKKVYTGQLIKVMSLFENLTKTRLKDCFEDKNGLLTFLVQVGEVHRAVGKKAENVKKLERMLNRKIKIVEFNPTLEKFIENLVFPLKTKNVWEEEGIATMESEDLKTRGLLIGRNASNLRNFEAIVKKYFPNLQELKVV